jgi:hypothetical protein
MKLVLQRVFGDLNRTFGVLMQKDGPFCVTLERGWLDNARGVSCIPVGSYTCLRCNSSPDYGYADSPHFGDTFQVWKVPGRQNILWHKGNVDDDTHGCIIVGESFGWLSGERAVLSSGAAFKEFLDLLKAEDSFSLDIR